MIEQLRYPAQVWVLTVVNREWGDVRSYVYVEKPCYNQLVNGAAQLPPSVVAEVLRGVILEDYNQCRYSLSLATVERVYDASLASSECRHNRTVKGGR